METLFHLVTFAFVFTFGASVGSFLNVVIYRLPKGMSLVYPPSHCPKCHHRLGKSENIPVFGWLWLGGRCRCCKTPISVRYPAVEALTGLLFCLVLGDFSFSWQTLGHWILLSWLLALALIDFDTMTLPNSLTQSGLVLGIVFQTFLGWQNNQTVIYLFSAIASAVLGVWLFDLIQWGGSFALGQQAMGGGDAKLAAMIGAWLGWQALIVTAFLACAIGAAIGMTGIFLGKMAKKQSIAFGPFLALGALMSVFWSDKIISAYQSIFFPLL
ncbi:type 4 prepilin-like proteins leader peptide-processing enzyme [Microcystis aeruginosa NIES-2519]|uniref:Prepilin leader peptidase/N-methyltransferase n=1 Tax=Microcystis aeruginosa NIES-2519 TaxID=2303981 RepID=A0A5A5RD39_MICAE|nr:MULTISPECIES: A24 family peptidase [Microcystis]AVQ73084.1 prepilin peptidase [Microcystis sp. MC19]GCA71087.1 type 4 prepilin-like proteins leader peptide-processing enzyme [Microcystis aeruginosa NIES-2519]GCA82833.1 type 4 prepilin-like proteins leader peptide-processing enzyme [Microcystis aeruginosa NIES-2522]GCA87269.1 type 4 prepiliN-like proteins leader peptide-processing enzyme [Microcystis aeruginosa NIES-4264]